MSITKRQVELTEEVTAGMVTIRKNMDGTGLIEFNVIRRTSVDGNKMGEERVTVLQRTFAEIGARQFQIAVDGKNVNVTGKMVLDALEAMFKAFQG